MSVKNIVTVPNQILRQKTEKVKKFDSELNTLIKDLIDTLNSAKEPEGAGIAATQVGSNKRICIVRDFYEDPNNFRKILADDYVLINPKIVSTSKETNIDWEGCLSVPNEYGKVQRYNKIKVDYEDVKGNKMRIKASDMFSRIIQHEVDHLDGVLFTDRVTDKTISEKEFDELYEKGLL